KTIPHRASERRIIAIRANIVSQHASPTIAEPHALHASPKIRSANFTQNDSAGVMKTQSRHESSVWQLSQPRNRPPRPILPPQKFIRRRIRKLSLGAIPLKSSIRKARGKRTQQHRL